MPVGDDEDFRRAGDHVDPDPAEDPPLRRRDIGVAGTDDLVDRRDRRGAIGQRRDRLRPADPVDLVDPDETRRRQHERVQHAVRRRHHHREPLDPGDPGRDRVHQHRRRIGSRAARHVEADRLDRPPALPEAHPDVVDVIDVGRQLPAMKGLDPLGRDAQARPPCRAERRRRRPRSRPGRGAAFAAVSDTRSKRFVYSTSAASPRPATSSMMRATTSSTSAALSRFAASSARNAASKPGSLVWRIFTALRMLAVGARNRRSAFRDCVHQRLNGCKRVLDFRYRRRFVFDAGIAGFRRTNR